MREFKDLLSPAETNFNPFEIYESIRPESLIRAEYEGPLRGEIEVSGTKNMVTKVIAASLSAEKGQTKISNIPFVGDLAITLALCRRLGVNFRLNEDKTLELEVGGFSNPNILTDPYHGNRVAILFAGPVLAKLGEANVSVPEGCKIGERKIDFHLTGLESFGVAIEEHEDYYFMRLKGSKLQAAHFDLPFPSVGATENLLITASCAEGLTTVTNCALEPEIIELIKILQSSGVEIRISPPRTIIVRGGKHNIVPQINIIPDRVEVASLATAALATRGDVFINGAQHEPLINFLGMLQEMGGGIEIMEKGIRFFYKGPLKPISITTEVYPGFPTDFQQVMAILMSQADGVSSIHETIFENRFKYMDELNNVVDDGKPMFVRDSCPPDRGCRFRKGGFRHFAQISGPVSFGTGEIEITDMRAGFAALSTAILSKGITVRGLKGLYRGYEDPVGKLKHLGANIELIL